MVPGLLVSLALSALLLVQSGELSVTFKSGRLPAAYQPASRRPAIFWLSATPPFEVIRLPENAGEKPLHGRIPAGESPGLPFLLAKGGDESSGYRVLFPDLNRNGDFTDDGPPILGTIVRKNEKITVYFPVLSHGASSDSDNAFPVSPPDGSVRFSFTPAIEKPLVGFYYPRRCMTGTVVLDGISCSVFMVDADADGSYTLGDLWALAENKESGAGAGRTAARGDFSAAGDAIRLRNGDYWRLKAISSDGSRAVLEAARSSKGRVQVPKPAPPTPMPRPTAEIEITWLETLSEAKQRAKKEGKPILLLLTVQGSTLCRTYLEHTFRDADVVELLGAVVPVHISCGEEDETTLQFGASGFPIVLILDDTLNIKNRIAGYRPAPHFVQILEVVLPW